MTKATKPAVLTPYTHLLAKNLLKGHDTYDDIIQKSLLSYYRISHIDIPEYKEENNETR
jgi:hypothetical protein